MILILREVKKKILEVDERTLVAGKSAKTLSLIAARVAHVAK